MATITISLVNGVLTLSDNGNTNASKSEVIIWHPGTGVQAVTGITVKPSPPNPASTPDFWKEAPAPNGVNYKGKIGDKDGDWYYTITTDVGIIDPRIQVKS